MVDLQSLDEAKRIVYAAMSPTPQYSWPLLNERFGCEVWVKHENHTPTGAFKVRGGLVYLNHLVRSGRAVRGLITATRGNHGQSIPFAARRHGIAVTVLAPHGNSSEKNRAMVGWGAKLITHGRDFDEARLEAARIAEAEDLEMVPPYHPDLVQGVATYALEFLQAVADLDAAYVPIGMGSGICGLIGVRDLLGLKTEIIGVVSDHAPAFALSFEAGHIVETTTADTFADGMACRAPQPEPFAIIRRGAARVVRVNDDEVAAAMRVLYTDTHNVAEGAGAAAIAAISQERERLKGKRVGAILCGGNVDVELFRTVLAGSTPYVGSGAQR